MQVLLILGGALSVTFGPKIDTDGPVTASSLVPLCLIAFQSSGQMVISRVLKYNGMTSVVLTSNYCDLFADRQLFTASIGEDPERNRRIMAPLLLLLGAAIGGIFAHSDVGNNGALWTALILKSMVMVAWIFWAAESQDDEGSA